MPETARKALILMNLGSPDSTEVKDVRRYLNEFLMDERVIDIAWLLRVLLVRGLIVPSRAPKSAEAYRTIWTGEGSPLVVFTRQLRDALQQIVSEPVAIAMRYGNPTPAFAYDQLLKDHPDLEEVIVLPLYPHYAMSSYETAVVHAKKQYETGKYPFKLSFIKPFYNEADYIDALAENIRPWLNRPHDHILFSYHGIPGRHLKKSDPTGCHCLQTADCCNVASPAHNTCYRHQVIVTTKLVTEKLGIPADKYSISFQSRLGKGWLEPFTDVRLEQMPAEGIRNLLILCPAFVSDCLETLEEIEERGKESFMHAGGESYTMIPCLNTHPKWVETIAGWLEAYKQGSNEMIFKGTAHHSTL
ncbi:ferrochelatase [Sediminibacterium ginsengisoli]|uniref:Ferrochelatase n=1 Tax=Sediminibacterium ginsengisoli TaxID=413434 RepID=A0A1T4K5E9_9BACT|nr:ferrochelatase [Sediminibacterium ginsengisoli]SJZ37641.1 ferrochelatase [Sediminibacterium ginsengisoli]